ncbi:hypothetical protein BDZ90DRAFT_126357 [Jaminaea rosea]|uniref:Zn(2)-C6 fungal-type domain-containing protein n=1 Tax=Jaminaea rosea TaxID=1569628 RepID=A0A316UG65_9BASI|nr:hypothetical protein BDZ90DRAFT_126357 [Jaminaea rosea]PWN24317.1 hypothetical protein BDZ90DRAFT_126357 [Jaminaea rosea]
MASADGPRLCFPESSHQRRHAAANRSYMACMPCRRAKHKCDGTAPAAVRMAPASGLGQEPAASHHPCSRCASRSLSCLWAPKARLGRPRKELMVSTTGTTSAGLARTTASCTLRSAGPLDVSAIPEGLFGTECVTRDASRKRSPPRSKGEALLAAQALPFVSRQPRGRSANGQISEELNAGICSAGFLGPLQGMSPTFSMGLRGSWDIRDASAAAAQAAHFDEAFLAASMSFHTGAICDCSVWEGTAQRDACSYDDRDLPPFIGML